MGVAKKTAAKATKAGVLKRQKAEGGPEQDDQGWRKGPLRRGDDLGSSQGNTWWKKRSCEHGRCQADLRSCSTNRYNRPEQLRCLGEEDHGLHPQQVQVY